MPFAYLRHLEVIGTPLELVEIIGLKPGSPPDRPHPGPGEPPGPVDPGYSPPWAQIPENPPGIWVPVFPTNPIQLPPWAGKPQPPIEGPGPIVVPSAVLFPVPTDMEVPPAPEGTPADYTPYVVWFGPGTLPTVAYVPPVATQNPVK